MYIDAFTVLLLGLLVKLLLGCLFLAFWLRTARASWFGWWSATFFIGSLAAGIFLVRGFGGSFLSIGVAVAALMASFGCCWQGARAFEKRTTQWLAVLVAPAIWLAACLVPGFLENVGYRVALSSALLSPPMAMTAFEFWRGREEQLPSRRAVIALFTSLALIFALRIPLIGLAPFPFGAQPSQPTFVAVFNLIVFFHTIVLAVLLVAMSKERLELQQRTKAQTDPLTGALNRRAFMTRGRRLVLRHQKESAPLCLLFIDLDHFKALNDRHGHSGGDDVLMAFVTVAHDNIRPTDFLFRIGGEEFCCLLPYTRADEAILVAERIRQQLEAAIVDVAGTPVRMTVSLGVASTDAFGYEVDNLVRHADMAVYAAKRQGRNRVVVATIDDPVDSGKHLPAIDGGISAVA